jgi:hypothetical protein
MTARPAIIRGGWLLQFLAAPVRIAYLACVVIFLSGVAQFYDGSTGFSSLISIGDQLGDSKVTALRQAPHYIYESSAGYDGAYYVQLALHPTLDNLELKKSIDNLPYRAKRILFCWMAWVLGLGQAAWIVQAHALLNVVAWLVLGWALLRWFPPTDWQNFLRWGGVMFCHGVCMSVRHSLVDAPSLVLVALALRWLEDGRRVAGAVGLAVAGLGKETSLLATASIDFDWRAPRAWGRPLLTVVLVVVPLGLWMGFIKWKFGPAEDPGLGNFTWPLVGYLEKWGAAWRGEAGREFWSLQRATVGVVVALGVQWLFFILRWRPRERWWRVGVLFALMMTFLATPVWEGYPGAATRVLLPMTLAFNILIPRGRRWLPVLLVGNLTVAASGFEFSPPREFFRIKGDAALSAVVRVTTSGAWHAPERHLEQVWRWSGGKAELRFVNSSERPVRVTLLGYASSVDEMRAVRVLQGEKLVWGETVGRGGAPVRFGFALVPGETVLHFSSDRSAQKVGSDPRELSFKIANLEIVLQPGTGPR